MGAAGIAGSTSDNDKACVVADIEVAGLTTDLSLSSLPAIALVILSSNKINKLDSSTNTDKK